MLRVRVIAIVSRLASRTLGVGGLMPLRFSADDRGVGRVARLLPLLIAAYELRFVLARVGSVMSELDRTGHAYLHSVVPWIVTLLALGAGLMLREAARGLSLRIAPPRWSTSLVGLWLLCSAALAAVLCGQDLCRELITSGHPGGGAASLFGSAGWTSIPVAMLVGFVLAASLHGACWVFHEARRLRRRTSGRRRSVAVARVTTVGLRPVLAPLLAGWSDRGPPAGLALSAA
jgi:hypothetical protein